MVLDLTVTYLTLASIISIGVAGVALLGRYRADRLRQPGVLDLHKVRWKLYAGTILVIVAVVLAAGFLYTEDQTNSRRSFSYRAVVSAEGNGTVLLLLPMPMDAYLLSNILASPSSSTASASQGVGNDSVSVRFSAPTTVSASFDGYRTEFTLGLTRTQGPGGSGGCISGANCSSSLSVTVLSGSVSRVHVSLDVIWSYPCHGYVWTLNADVLPGEALYPGRGVFVAC